MTLNYGIFDVSDPQNPDRVYSAALLSRILSKHIRDGIVHGDGDEMAVTVTDPPAMSVQVGTGTAMVQGRFCENDAVLTLSVPAAHATYPRIDRVVVRLNASPGRTIDIVVKAGTPAPEPAAPALTRTAEIWELSLAQVRVEAGATSILSAKITDERGNPSLCGVAAPQYVPSSQLEVVGAVDMQSNALTGLPVPNAATDAARKGYVDTEIAGAIGGFGISQIAIDADKDWNGKSITNVGAISVDDTADPNPNGLLRAYPSDIAITTSATERSYAGAGSEVVKKISVSVSGMYRVTCELKVNNDLQNGTAQILKNGVVVASFGGIGQAYAPRSADLAALAGEEFQIRLTSPDPAWRVYVRNFAIRGSCAVVPKATRTVPAGTVVLD